VSSEFEKVLWDLVISIDARVRRLEKTVVAAVLGGTTIAQLIAHFLGS